MADEVKLQEGAGDNEPHGEENEPDYKALYEAEKLHSRKWEKQAKANRSAADELEKAREAGKTAEEQIAYLKKRLDAKEKAEQHAKLAAKVAEKKGIPVDLIQGDDEESMEAGSSPHARGLRYNNFYIMKFKKGELHMINKVQPWSFTIEFDPEKAKRHGYEIETLYDYVGINVEKYGLCRIGYGTWKAKPDDEVESQCLALSMLSNMKWVMQNIKSLIAFEDDTDPIDCLAVFRKTDPQCLCV